MELVFRFFFCTQFGQWGVFWSRSVSRESAVKCHLRVTGTVHTDRHEIHSRAGMARRYILHVRNCTFDEFQLATSFEGLQVVSAISRSGPELVPAHFFKGDPECPGDICVIAIVITSCLYT